MATLLQEPAVEQRHIPRPQVGRWADVPFAPRRPRAAAPRPEPRTVGEFALACILTPLNFVSQALL